MCKIDDQGKFDAGNRALKVGCSGTTQRDGVGWEMGRGFRKGLPAILIPACVSSSPAILMMYSAYEIGRAHV